MNKELGIKNIVSGLVIHGDGFGKTLGFPTANLDRKDYSRRRLKIRFGVWAGWGEVKGKRLALSKHRAAIVIGPLDKTGLPKIEVHLINFKGNLYGKKITISLQQYIRPFKNYKNVELLKKQIALDIKKVNKTIS